MTFLEGQWQAEVTSLIWKDNLQEQIKAKAKSLHNDTNNGILDRIDSSYFKRKKQNVGGSARG